MNNYYINATVVNTGNGEINTGDISNNNPTLYIEDTNLKEQINELISKLKDETAKFNNDDLKASVETIADECKKPSWTKKTLKSVFNAIQGIATGIAANQLTPIVARALTLLG